MANRRVMNDVDLIAQIADLKQIDYQNTLVITALVELLADKGIVSRHDVLTKARQLDTDLETKIEQLSSTSPLNIKNGPGSSPSPFSIPTHRSE